MGSRRSFRRVSQRRSAPKQSSWRTRRSGPRWLRFELLEDRRLLATITWSGSGDGTTWTNPANWIGGAVPGPDDDAVIGSQTQAIDISGDITVGSITSAAPLDITSGSLTLESGASQANDGLTIAGGTSLTATGSGTSFSATGTTVTDEGTVTAQNNAIVDVQGSLDIAGQGALATTPSSVIQVDGNLLGNTQNAAGFDPTGTVEFDSTSASSNSPQLLEAMSDDLGPNEAGFANNFAYGTLSLSNDTYVQLVDQSHNSDGTGSEAVYADAVAVPAGSTLDLNGLNLYTHSAQVNGTVINGTIQTVSYGAATQLVVTSQPPADALAGLGFGVAVSAEDQYGNLVTSYSGTVSLALAAGPSGSTLAGNLSVTMVDGQATFTNLTLGTAGQGYQLTASASGLASSTTDAFAVVPAPSSLLTVTTLSDATTHTGTSLRDAIAQADTDVQNGISDTIVFDPSLAGGTITLSQGVLDLSGAGTGTIAIYGGGQIAISGNNASSVFQVYNNVNVAIAGLTIEDGDAAGAGGGINNSGTLTVSSSTFLGNTAPDGGGAIWNSTYAGALTVSNSTFFGNSAPDDSGGAILNESPETLTVSNSTLSGNLAGGYGGGVENDSAAFSVTGSSFVGNSGEGGGGGIWNGGTLTVDETMFEDNLAGPGQDGAGGGIWNGGTLTVDETTFEDDSAGLGQGGAGGGIWNGGTLTVDETTFEDDSAGPDVYSNGGGIFSSGTLTVANSTFAGGGGISESVSAYSPESETAIVYGSTFSGSLGDALSANSFGGTVELTVTDSTFTGNAGGIATGGSGGQDLTVANSTFSDTGTGIAAGGTLTVTDSTFDDNSDDSESGLGGGAIDSYGALSLSNCVFSGNSCFGEFALGGAIYSSGTLSVSNCVFSGNSAAEYGGAIYATGADITVVSDSTFSGNSAGYWGGAISTDNNADGSLTVSNSTFSGNSAVDDYDEGYGGAIFAGGDNFTLSVSNSTFSGNSADEGGAIFGNGGAYWNIITSVSNSTFVGNSAAAGGGVYNDGLFTAVDSTFSGNSATASAGGSPGMGGGIYSSSTLMVTNSTFVGNSAAAGGGVYNTGSLTTVDSTFTSNFSGSAGNGGGLYAAGNSDTLINTIVAGNDVLNSTVADDLAGTTSVTGSNNLIGTGGSGGLVNGIDGNLVGVADPGLDPAGLGANGGPTQTVALVSGSPAIGAGGSVTTLSAAVTDATSTTIAVADAAAIASTPGQSLIQIDGEDMLVTGVDLADNTLTVERGFGGTTAATHSAGAAVYLATDQRGVVRPAALQDIGAFQYDTSGLPITAAIVSAPPQQSTSSSATFTFSASVPGTIQPSFTFEASLDGGPFVAGSSVAYSGVSTGTHTLEVLAVDQAGDVSAPVFYTWTTNAPLPAGAQLAVAGQPPATVPAGGAFALTVAMEDADGNVLGGFNGSVTVALDSNPDSDTLGGTLTVTAINGIAVFSNLTLNNVGNGFTLQVSVPNLTPVTTSAFDVTGTFTWSGAGDGTTWTNPANWTDGDVPGPGDNAVIGSQTQAIQISGNITVGSITSGAPLDITSGSLTLESGTSQANDGLTVASGASLTATGTGTSFTATGTTVVDGASLYAENGGSISLPGVASYTGWTGNTTTLEATGAGSSLSLANLSSLSVDTTNYYSNVQFEALAGGQVNLPSLAQVDTGPVLLESDGSGSALDISSLASFTGNEGQANYSTLQATNGGTVDDGALTSLNNANLTLDGSSTISTSQITTFTYGTLSITGGSPSFSALTDVDASTVFVSGGATVGMPEVSAYSNHSNVTDTFQASGVGSSLSLANLNSLSVDTTSYYSNVQFEALAGGQVNLSSLAQIDTGPVLLESDGSGSVLNISSLASFTGNEGQANYSALQATNGATVDDGALLTFNYANLTLDGSSTISTSQITGFSYGTLTVSGGSPSFAALVNIDESSIQSSGGATVNLSAVTSYTGWTGNTTTLEASGTGSSLSITNLSNLSVDTTSYYSNVQFEALAGGQVNLSGLTQIDTGPVWLECDGSGSVLNISSLASFTGNEGQANYSTLQATNGGTVEDGALTEINYANLTLDGLSTISTSQLRGFSYGTLTVSGGSPSFAALVNIDASSILTSGGATVNLSAVTSYTGWTGNTTTLEATGVGSSLSMANLSSLTVDTTSYYSKVQFEALAGGQVNLSSLTQIDTGPVLLESDGSGSVLNISSLAGFTGNEGQANYSTLRATNGATVEDDALTEINYANLTLNDAGAIATSQITTIVDATASITGGTNSLTNWTIATGTAITVGPGTTLEFAGGNVVFPASLTSSTVSVPLLPTGAVLSISSGTFESVTFVVGQNVPVTISGGTFLGNTLFDVDSGSVIDLTGGNSVDYSGSLAGSGSGTVELSGGTLALGLGGLTLNFPGSMFQWTGGIISSSLGNLTNLGTMNLTGGGDMGFFNDGTLDDFGTIIQSGSGNLDLHSDNVTATTLKIEPGAAYLIESNAGIDNDGGGQTAVINQGTIEKTAGAGTSTLYIPGNVSNTGTIEADSGTLYIDATTVTQISGTAFTGGTWTALEGATIELPGSTNVTSNQATLTIDGPGASISGLGSLATNSGSLALGNGASLTTAADFTNSGTLTVGAGASGGGTLNVAGSFTQTSSGTLTVQIGGTPASGDFGQLLVTGTATLAGTFNPTTADGFGPTVGDSYSVMTFTSGTGEFATVSQRGAIFTQQLTGTNLLVNVPATTADLLPTTISATASAFPGQSVTVTWQAENEGSAAAVAPWQDAVYLSTTPSITAQSTLLGTETESASVPASGTYAGSLTAALPALVPGYYYVLVVVDSLYQVSDSDRANNTLAASGTLDVTVPALTPGTPTADTFTAADQEKYYQVTVPAGGSLVVSLTSTAASGATALYVAAGTLPTPYSFTAEAAAANQPNQTLTIPDAQATTYYILAEGVSGDAATAGFTITTTQTTAITVSSLGLAQGGNGGNITIPITGTNFTPNTAATLTLGGTTIDATSIDYASASEIYVTFPLNGATLGNYTLAVQQGGLSVDAASTFQALAAAPANANPLQIVLNTPALVSAGRDSDVTVTITNTGNNDVLAPLLELTTDGATLKLPSQATFQGESLWFLAISTTGPAGTLLPGASTQVTIQFQSTTTAPTINFQVEQAEDNQPMDWASQESSLQIPTIPDAAWSIVYANFEANMGTTVADYHAVLAADATYLAELGEPTDDVLQLVEFEIEKAAAAYTAGTLVTVTPEDLPAPGMDLTFEQSYLGSISGRYYEGILGALGWATNWDITASTDSSGNAIIQMSGDDYYFFLQANGTYQPEAGDEGETLTLSGGAFTLVEAGGTTYQFNADGSLDYVQDSNGNRITCGYNASNQLVSLTDANGESIDISYNAQGQLATLSDSAGQAETYAYSGQQLTSYSDVYGTTTYSYVSGGTAAQNGALDEIAYADDTHIYFSYDTQGRLIDQHRDGGAEDETFTYLTPGGLVVTDADGNKTTTLFNLYGATIETIDPLGNITTYQYDNNLDLVAVDGPQGADYTYTYDADGNMTSETDPLGQTTTFTYNSADDLTSYTDANGDTTGYAYNGNNNLLSVTYANGTSQQYSYNPLGEATSFLNANGDAVGYTYNADGLVAQETFANGTSYSYTYNAQGNMTSATDGSGNVTTFLYGDASNPDLLTEVEYPDGTWLKFSYNIVGQRTQSVDQTGFTVDYIYDSVGRLSELTNGSGDLIVQYSYDVDGNLIGKDNGNGTYTTYTYDADGNVLSITNYAPGGTVNSFDDYTYDALGNVLTDTSQDGQWVYGYDADSELTSAVFTPNATDPDGLPAQNIQYVYNAVGNRLSEAVNGVTTTYVSNSVDEYTSSTTAGVTTTYQYDDDGNLIGQTDPTGTTVYTYNELNELTGVTGPGLTASYAYDPLGNQISQTIDGATTNFQVDPTGLGNIVATFSGSGVYNNSGGLTAHYTYGLGLVSQVSAAGTSAYYDFNNVGSTVGITNSGGSYVNTYAYQPFGQTTTVTSTLTNPFTFVGELGVMSEAGGLLDMRARSYDPGTAQFMSNDPLGLLGGTNVRSYAGNTPINRSDSSGFDDATDPAGAIVSDLMFQGLTPEWMMMNTALPEALYYFPRKGPGVYFGRGYCAVVKSPKHPGPFFKTFVNSPSAYGSVIPLNQFIPMGVGLHGDPANCSGGASGGGGCPCHCPPPVPPQPPKQPGPGGSSPNGTPADPNALIGPAGYGAQGYIQPSGSWSYAVDFENDGTAAALDATVTEQLSSNLNWSTFQLGSFGFGSVNVTVPAGLMQYQTTVDYENSDGSSLDVDVDLDFDEQTGLLSVTFTSIDPTTGLAPTGILDGFLPPDDSSHVGEGYVQFTVQPNAGLTTGTAIDAQAAVVFDTNAPIDTAEVVNTVDVTPPTSSVAALPATEASSTFTVSWSGSDTGSGVASYDVYVSDDGGAYTLWQTDTTATSASFTGTVGDTYNFYSVATDNVGNVQPTPTSAQATTTITSAPEAPVLAVNTGLTLAQDTTATIGTGQLQVTDSGVSDSQLVFTIVTAPADGTLADNGTALAAGSTFTESDIDNDDLKYTNTSGTSDSFVFSVSNGAGGSIPDTTFDITVTVPPAAPTSVTLDTNSNTGGFTGFNYTSDDTPQIDITAAAGGTVTLSMNGTVIATATGGSSGSYTAVLPAGTLAVGANSITATVTASNGTSTASSPLSITYAPNFAQVYTAPGIPGTAETLDVDWISRSAAYNDEVGWFTVSSLAGTVDGIAPGQSGYAQAAIRSTSQVIFPSGDQGGETDTLSVTGGQLIVFYMVQNDNTADFLASNPSDSISVSPLIFFTATAANPDNFQHVQVIQNPTTGQVQYNWEDMTYGGDTDFNDVVMTVSLAGTPSGAPGALEVPGGGNGNTVNIAGMLLGNTSLGSAPGDVGFYYVTNTDGDVNGIAPGSPGYAAAALASGNYQVLFGPGAGVGNVASDAAPAGSLIAFYAISSGTTPNFMASNSANSTSGGPVAFFSFNGANPDSTDHFRFFSPEGIATNPSQMTLHLMDQLFGNDSDYDSLAMTLNMGSG